MRAYTPPGHHRLLRPSRTSVAPRWRAAASFSGNDPGDVFGKLKNKQFLDAASKRYQLGATLVAARGWMRFAWWWHGCRCILWSAHACRPYSLHRARVLGPCASCATAIRYSPPGLDNGIDEDEMVSMEFGTSEVLEQYKDKVKEKLQQRAAELKAEEEERLQRLARNYLKGKEAYE